MQSGHVDEGITWISKGLAGFRVQGLESFRSYNQALLAEDYGKSDQAKSWELRANTSLSLLLQRQGR